MEETWSCVARECASTSERENLRTGHGTIRFFNLTCVSRFRLLKMSSHATIVTTSRMYPVQPLVVLPAKFPHSSSMYKMRNIHEDTIDTRPCRHDAANTTATEAKMPDDAVVSQVIRLLQVAVSFPFDRNPRLIYRPWPRACPRQLANARAVDRGCPNERDMMISRKFPRAH